jgi:hypothetical protein
VDREGTGHAEAAAGLPAEVTVAGAEVNGTADRTGC